MNVLFHIKAAIINLKRDKRLHNKPSRVVIETTNNCNLNCPFCLVGMQDKLLSTHGSVSHSLMRRPRGVMGDDVFECVRNEINKFRIRKVYLHFQGEPLLNKRTPRFAKILKGDGLEVGIFTNGQAFTEKNIEALARAEVDLIRFSVDGASEETYRKNRVGGKFKTVYENMKHLRKAHAGKKTRIEWQFLPLKNNEHEVNIARRMAKQIGVHFFTKNFRETDEDLAPVNSKYKSRLLQKPCTDIYKQLCICWNGDVVPCCYDVEATEIMGNICSESLKEIWYSHRYATFREKVDGFKICPENEPQICKSCLRWGIDER